jgi:hypothetical protein
MTTARTLTIALAAATAAIAPNAALAKGGGVTTAGSCSKASTAKLKIGEDNGRIETEFEVDQNRNGVRWQVVLRRNGRLVVSTVATTRAPSGSFELRRLLSNGAGGDRITAQATSPSGEICVARATV